MKYYTLETDSEFAIKDEDFLALSHEKPLGITGHLRVKNEPKTIRLSIETSIPALDQLIITCQPFINPSGVDETYIICQEMQKKYPHKIDLHYYTPEVVAVDTSHIDNQSVEVVKILERFNNKIPENSIHSIAHYYNFGLVKAKYQYYVKIDADQIYLTSKFIKLRQAIFATDYLHKKERNKKIPPNLIRKLFLVLYIFIVPLQKYNLALFIKLLIIINKKCAFGLVGLNIGKKQHMPKTNQNYVHLSELQIPFSPKTNGGFNIFNGGHDNPIVYLDSNMRYILNAKRYIEQLELGDTKVFSLFGIFFLHYGLEKRGVDIKPPSISLQKYGKTKTTSFFRLQSIRKNYPFFVCALLKKLDAKEINLTLEKSLKI